MSTETIHADHGYVEGFDRSHDAKYWKIAVVLAVLTGIEVTTYSHESFWNDLHEKAAIVVLLTLMMVKFVMITWYFMHLEGDWQKGSGGKLLTYVFYAGLALAAIVYLVLLFSFRVIPAPWEWF